MAETVLKRFNVSDVFSIPYTANKQWSVPSSSFVNYNIFTSLATYPTASNKKNYTQSDLLYQSLLANYYPEFYFTSSHTTSSYSQTNYWSTNLSTSSYDGFQILGNGATTIKYFPTTTGSYVYVLNVPNNLYSNKILPLTVELEVSGGKIYDDGEYNLRYSGSSQTSSLGIISQSSYVGNVFYEQGLLVFTNVPTSMLY